MACLNNLKQDIKRLEVIFPKTHDCFQLISATVDELTCRFVNKNGRKFDIYANFTVSICQRSCLSRSFDQCLYRKLTQRCLPFGSLSLRILWSPISSLV